MPILFTFPSLILPLSLKSWIDIKALRMESIRNFFAQLVSYNVLTNDAFTASERSAFDTFLKQFQPTDHEEENKTDNKKARTSETLYRFKDASQIAKFLRLLLQVRNETIKVTQEHLKQIPKEKNSEDLLIEYIAGIQIRTIFMAQVRNLLGNQFMSGPILEEHCAFFQMIFDDLNTILEAISTGLYNQYFIKNYNHLLHYFTTSVQRGGTLSSILQSPPYNVLSLESPIMEHLSKSSLYLAQYYLAIGELEEYKKCLVRQILLDTNIQIQPLKNTAAHAKKELTTLSSQVREQITALHTEYEANEQRKSYTTLLNFIEKKLQPSSYPKASNLNKVLQRFKQIKHLDDITAINSATLKTIQSILIDIHTAHQHHYYHHADILTACEKTIQKLHSIIAHYPGCYIASQIKHQLLSYLAKIKEQELQLITKPLNQSSSAPQTATVNSTTSTTNTAAPSAAAPLAPVIDEKNVLLLAQCQKEIEQCEADIASLTQATADFESEQQKKTEQDNQTLEKYRIQIASLQQEIAELNENYQKTIQTTTEAQVAVKQLKKQQISLKAETDALQKTATQLKGTIQTRETEKTKLTQVYQSKAAKPPIALLDDVALSQRTSDYQAQVLKLTQAQTQTQEQSVTLKQKTEQLNHSVEVVLSENQKCDLDNTKLTQEKTAEHQRLEAQITQIEQHLSQGEQLNAQLNNQCTALEQQFQNLVQQGSQTNQVNSQIHREKINELQTIFSGCARQMADLAALHRLQRVHNPLGVQPPMPVTSYAPFYGLSASLACEQTHSTPAPSIPRQAVPKAVAPVAHAPAAGAPTIRGAPAAMIQNKATPHRLKSVAEHQTPSRQTVSQAARQQVTKHLHKRLSGPRPTQSRPKIKS